MKRIVFGLLLLALCAVGALLLGGRSYLTTLLRLRLEREITRAVGSPTRIDELDVSVFPLGVRVRGIVVGEEPTIARVDRVAARVATLASLAEGRPVLTVHVESPVVDLSQLPKSDPAAATKTNPGSASWPPVHLKRLEVTQARLRFRMGNTTANLTVASLAGQLKMGLVQHSLTAGVEVSGIELQRKSYRVQVDEIRADGGADSGGLFVNTASVGGAGINAAVTATTTPHRHAVSATFDPGILGVVVDELSLVGGQAQLEGTLNDDLANPVLDGRLVIQQGAIGQHRLGDLDTHVTRKGTRLSFDDLRLAGAAGEVRGAVDLTIDKEVPIHGELRWQGVDLERLLTVIGQPVPFGNLVNATTTVHGALDPLDLSVTGSGVLQTAAAGLPKEVADFNISGRVHPHDVDAQLEVSQPERNKVGTRVVIEGRKFTGRISLNADDFSALNAILPQPVRALALTGQGEGTAEFSGTTDHPMVSGAIMMRNFSVVGTGVSRLNGDFAIAAGTLSTRATKIETAAGSAELSGTLALDAQAPNDWRLKLRDLETDLLFGLARGLNLVDVPLSGGTLNGTFACRSTWMRAETQAELTATALHIGSEPLDRIEVHSSTTLPQWTLQLKAIHAANETVTISGTGEGQTRLQLAIDSNPLNLATWRGAERLRVAGTIVVHGQLAGRPLQPSGSLAITASGLGVGRHKVGDVELRADGRDGDWTLKSAAFGGTLDIAATLRSTATLPYTLTATWRDTNLAELVFADQSLQVTTSGELNLTGSLRTWAASSGALRVTRFEVGRDQGQMNAPEPIRVDLERGRFRIFSLVLAVQGSRLSVTGQGTTAGDVQLDLRGDGDLVLLELIGGPFHSARGQLGVTARVVHATRSGWELRGQAAAHDVAIDLGLPVAFTDTNATFTFAGSSVQIDNLTGRAGGGEFTVGGSVDLNRGPAISWSVHEVGLTMQESLEGRVSGQGQAQGTWKLLTVSGDIEVLNALYDRRFELTDLLPWFKQQVAPAPRIEPPATEVRLDLHIHAPDGLFVDNNFAKVEMRADLRITGVADKPTLNGTVEILNGEVTFQKRVFTITAGSIEFQDPYRINPILNINAESRIPTADADYTVSVAVSGTADEPRVLLSADDPSLTQNDALTLVTSGKTTAQLQREGGGVNLGDVLSLVPTGAVERQLGNVLGVDRFEVEPVSSSTGAIEPRVSVGKDITDRLRVLAATSLRVDAHNSVQVEYRIKGRISLLGSWESASKSEAGAFGGEIKFRYEFRRVPFSLFRGDSDSSAHTDVP